MVTLNRPKALNALSLPMVREITRVLMTWQHDDQVKWVAMRGMGKTQAFGVFCAGGDIRFFHQAAVSGDPSLEDFFTEEYQLNHLIHRYQKPFCVFMDGVVMGGGMGLAQGASWRIATEQTKMAMPETMIGLFPDVGGGFFLSRCPGFWGEYLGLTGQVLDGAQAVYAGLADVLCPSADLPAIWQQLSAWTGDFSVEAFKSLWQPYKDATFKAKQQAPEGWDNDLERVFGLENVRDIMLALSQRKDTFAMHILQALRKRSPLMLAVTLMQIRRARHMPLAEALRMERDMVRHCFHPTHLERKPYASETVEGIRALAIDKDHAPNWLPASIEQVTDNMVQPFFDSPWPAHAHPLRLLSDA
ncbi:MAG: enoyl-CoA hydratase/isomerase family protein [Limnohabitans sp.]